MIWDNNLYKKYMQFRGIGEHYQNAIQEGFKNFHLPRGLWVALGKADLFSETQNYDSKEKILFTAAALEGLSYSLKDGGVSISLASHLGLCLPILYKYGTPVVKEKYFDLINKGKILAAFASTEPTGGSNPQKLLTKLKRTKTGYLLNGNKWSITNAPIAGIILTTGREAITGRALSVVVDPSWKGVDCRHVLKPAGLRCSPVGNIIFHNVKIPDDFILGNGVDGITIMEEAFLRERLLAPFAFIGLMQRLLDDTFYYAQHRNVCSRPITENQYIRKRITDMRISLDTTKSLAHYALNQFLEDKNSSLFVSMGKLYAANQAVSVATNAIKIMGSHGVEEGGISEALMSSVLGTIAGGTEEIHREVIFTQMYREYRKKWRKNGISYVQ